MNSRFDYAILDAINNAFRAVKASPLVLGATASGVGGPPGGFVGYLPQTRVTYDSIEAETLSTPVSGMSILDNLNHIRSRIAAVEVSGVFGSGATTFVELLDTPSSYAGSAGLAVVINGAEDGLEFTDLTYVFSGITVKSGGSALAEDIRELDFYGASIDIIDNTAIITVTGSGGGIEEAPVNGYTYGRKDAGWVVTSGAGGGAPGFQTLTYSSGIDWNLALGSAKVSLSGNATILNPTNMAPGEHYFLEVVQASGSSLLSYGDSYKFPSNVKPVLSTVAGSTDIITFDCNGTLMFGTGTFRNMTASGLVYVNNLLMWLKADTGVYSDDGVTPCVDTDTIYLWEDQSGSGNNAVQVTGGNRPVYRSSILNGLPVARFDGGSSHVLVSAMDATDNCSFFMVIIPSTTTPVGLFDSTGGAVPPIRNWPAGVWESYSESPAMDITQVDTSPVLIEMVHSQSSGRTISYYKNGTLVTSTTNGDTNAIAWGDPRIGSINDGAAGWYEGDIAEFLLYSEKISDSNRAMVESYLMERYGLV
jgi:hypothetical protein